MAMDYLKVDSADLTRMALEKVFGGEKMIRI